MFPTLLVLASTYPRWANDAEPGFVHELARRLTDRFRIVVVCPHAPGAKTHEIMEGVEVVRYRYAPERWETLVNNGGIVANLKLRPTKLLLMPSFVLMQGVTAWRICRLRGVDVIHAHWLVPQGLIASMLPRVSGRRKPFIVTSHGADLYALRSSLFQKLKRHVLRRAAAVTVVSDAMSQVVTALGVSVRRLEVRPMGVDLSGRFTPRHDVPRNPYELLFVGRLVEKKGLRHLLNALPQVRSRIPQVSLTVAGFGPEEDELRAAAARLGLADCVRFIGAVAQADLPALYWRAALFVAPFVRAASGDEEGLGLVVVEALGCACPVLVGNVPAVRHIFGDQFDNMTVDPTDTVQLTARLVDALSEPHTARRDAEVLRRTLVERMDWSVVAQGYADLLESVLKTPTTQPRDVGERML